MSPLGVRRWRAELELRRNFEALRARVLDSVRGRLRRSGAYVAEVDLDACYALAWQGLYAAILAGEEIENPTGWLVVVTHRRALDELRSQARARRAVVVHGGSADPDLAAELDERARLREVLEALRSRLSTREREAAVLCYLQGLTRTQAARQLGMSERSFRKLMEGRGRSRPGVAAKMGALLATVGEGRWCEEQASLMRALAFGVLDPRGERYALARDHSSACPACRAYVASLRGLAAVLPPVLVPALLSPGTAAGLFGQAGARALLQTGRAGAGVPVGGAPVAAGASAAAAGGGGGGWVLTGGSLSAKLAVGCVLALGVGGGCVDLGVGVHGPRHAKPQRPKIRARRVAVYSLAAGGPADATSAPSTPASETGAPSRESERVIAAARAQREFGIEQASSDTSAVPETSRREAGRGVARTSSRRAREARRRQLSSESGGEPAGGSVAGSQTASPAAEAQAQREFGPG